MDASLAAGMAAAGASVARFGPATTPAMFMSCILPGELSFGGWLAGCGCASEASRVSCRSCLLLTCPLALLCLSRTTRYRAGHEYDGAVMVTASHLPVNRNGAKFCTAQVKSDARGLLAACTGCLAAGLPLQLGAPRAAALTAGALPPSLSLYPLRFATLQGGLEKKDITALLTRAAALADAAGQRPSDRHTDAAFVIGGALQAGRGLVSHVDFLPASRLGWALGADGAAAAACGCCCR